ARECYQRRLLALVSTAGAPATELPRVDAAVEREGGFLADNCHILMHWVGRNYAVEHHVTLGTLQTYLPRTNDPGCSAGFAHGLISALGSSINQLDPESVAAVCAGLSPLQRQGCITGASAIFNSGKPDRQVEGCADLAAPDRVPCARGVATQDLTAKPLRAMVQLVALCDRFGEQRQGCVAW